MYFRLERSIEQILHKVGDDSEEDSSAARPKETREGLAALYQVVLSVCWRKGRVLPNRYFLQQAKKQTHHQGRKDTDGQGQHRAALENASYCS